MHLEKVTTRSSEAGLAGWIASNDVTLFTMVMIMVIAMFLHTRVNKGQRENLQLEDENASISATLASTASDLDSARELLDRTSSTLALTQQERDQLQSQLVEKLAALAELNAKLDAMLAENGQLETERQALLSEKSELEDARSSLDASNLSLRERLDLLSDQLAKKVAALAEVEAQRDRLTKQGEELDAIIAALKQRLEEMNIELVEARDQADEALVASNDAIQKLQAAAATSDKQAEEYLAQLKRAAALLQSLKSEKQQLQYQLTETERLRQSELLEQAENNRKLVGLTGQLKRVAILVDASGSMRQDGAGGGDRWAEAQSIAATYLGHLNVQHCVLIVYSSRVRTFPNDGSLADVRGPAGKANREALLRDLATVTPGGWTNTLEALRTAYDYNVDTIVLLSDGAPSTDPSGKYDDALAQQIYGLCRQHPGTPVNAIGLGNYFDTQLATFLRTVAEITGGAFRGE